ncbi:hypothetical protein O181_117240 [Austropuccinia psidii MF-1]|uniref:Retrovirus-related Pol polyprotein from transposon TNT 1-94-like beta-barrel domain-containing protein n=1 Tax=Austropuccinia psidii MF-1 TaxID=1389203 RepID=A0A9Q3KE11_9BASI|nr:hypothetical protein [Austropuccinia psidii MF-1]
MITTLAIYYVVPSMHHLIIPAISTLMETNPEMKVRPDDLLNMIWQIAMASPSLDHSTEIAGINSTSRCSRRESHSTPNDSVSNKKPTITTSGNPQANVKVPSSRFPCHYCGEVRHWLPKCPIKAKAIGTSNKAQHQRVDVAGIGVLLALEGGEALLYSGATHLVVGNLLLFTSLTSTNMTLSVASSKSYKVDAIGTIVLNTSSVTFRLHNVLYCHSIPGVILSLGNLLKEHFSIYFSNDLFTITTLTIQIATIKRHDWWFIPFIFPTNNSISVKSLLSHLPI